MNNSIFDKLSTQDLHTLSKAINLSLNKNLKEWFLENLTDEDSSRLRDYNPLRGEIG